MRFQLVPQGLAPVDPVAVASPLLGDRKKTFILEVAYDFLHGALGNSYHRSHITKPGFPVARQTYENMPVVTEKSPITHHMHRARIKRPSARPKPMDE
jgi:hypothetical protein